VTIGRIVLSLRTFADALPRVLGLVITSVFVSATATLLVVGIALRLPLSAVPFVGIVVAACMPVCFIAWLWKGTAILETVIRWAPFHASEPIRSTVVSGLFGVGLLDTLLIAAAQISPESEARSISAKLILGITAWGFLQFALLGFWLGRAREARN
jgi:hypothetical protein